MKRGVRFLFLTLVAAFFVLPGLPSCHVDNLLRAKIIEYRSELVGGPVAMADIGDFLLENDKIRVAILTGRDSPGPGVFGGAIVDIDRRRPQMGFEGGQGRDRFADAFPLANLIVPDPTATDVRVVSDGSDGKEAGIRVEGDGEFLFEAISLLRTQQDLLSVIFPNVRTKIRFQTDYVLHPGDQFITIRTILMLGDDPPAGCEPVTSCGDCPHGYQQDANGCLTCDCSQLLTLDTATSPVSVFGSILGDTPTVTPFVNKAGIVAGDFVFFGNQNDVFAPGPGFDEDTAVQEGFNAGQNSFTQPLLFDFVAAAGGDISYGYFTTQQPGQNAPVVNVPLFASAATAFMAASKNCLFDSSDDAICDAHRSFFYERYLAVGDGDVNSVTQQIYQKRGTKTGTVTGHVLWKSTLEAVPNASIYVFANPDPSKEWKSIDDVVRANQDSRNDVGLLNAIDADLGLDKSEDGDFRGVLPPGNYILVAKNPNGSAFSDPIAVKVKSGSEVVVTPVLSTPATVQYRISDQAGNRMPAKLAFVSLDSNGKPLLGDGTRKVYMGEGRLGNGIRLLESTASGEGEVEIEPGRYRIIVSRGIEYGLYQEADVTLSSGRLHRIDATLIHEVNTDGWMSVDMHLHSKPSFDSGMPLPRRVTTAAAEGLELAVSTDHDVETDYLPTIRSLNLQPFLASAIGAEITTLEQGHFIGFPLHYDELNVPSHGAHDWTCESGGQILDAIRGSGDGTVPPLTIVAHPRDGFFGYVDQLGVDAYTMNRTPTFLEENNPVFRTASCDFDAMELINGKRFDLVRTGSVSEVVDWNRCLVRVNTAMDPTTLTAACPEISGWLRTPCGNNERFADCKRRARNDLAWATTKRLLARTPEEQNKNWDFPGSAENSQALCDLTVLGNDPVLPETMDQPCTYRAGHVDDYFRYLERGLLATQIASSDSHDANKEPGYPRTYFRSQTDSPAALRVPDAVESLRAGHAFTTYGPFIRATIDDKSFGEVVAAGSKTQLELHLDVQTASWFGVDRVEVYMNGRMIRLIEPTTKPSAIVDVHGKVTFNIPPRDSWVVVIAMGLKDENLMSLVSLDVPFGELQLSKLTSDAFGMVPVVNTLFTLTPTVPDWAPTPPYAVTNPIYIDTDGNGKYDPPLPFPDFCSKPCDPTNLDPEQCPIKQVCLDDEKVCGFPILGRCDHRRPAMTRE